ncbi:cupin domain-containing protein [Pseudarthrobacter sp. NIBRBAC000502771]|uniref:cupin domain-containing protein n=1 Tax=Pseudarthrobacter sp. NIBRBAC000502771 TaxID=2590774 RepID=UPI0011305C48|nr:cupin domain-containing protein [Pseudarthrobacter sp. NIBRBAC000502771]QDG63741.1 cupin domain-containing protein [Pseudarthrobacter sp. NIBRBAC000502771]
MLTLPPDSVFFSTEYDPVLVGQEFAEHAVGFAERMEPDAPGFHRTQTVYYVWVAKGQVVLETDTGEVTLDENDVVVQHGTRHAWRNPRDNSATLSVVLVGVEA